jgi:hypothetical protein
MLHVFVGRLITLFLFSNKVKGIIVLLVLVSMALGKKFYDHFFVLGHCYPVCMGEHISDFLFSLLFFFCYIPILSFTQKNTPRLSYKYYIVIGVCVGSAHLAFIDYLNQQSKVTLLASNIVCRTN